MRSMRIGFHVLTSCATIGVSAALPVYMFGCGHDIAARGGPVLTSADLGLASSAEGEGYTMSSQAASTGRFPTAIAVARVEPAGDAQSKAPPWRVVTLKEEQATYWNALFNTTPEIRDLLVLSERTPLVRGEGVKAVAGSAARLNATLCLVYGPAHASPGEAALLGNLLDAQTGESIARVSARATVADFETARSDRPEGDQRHRDVEYLAARKFELLFRDCILDLIRQDAAPTATRPSKWQGSTPPEKSTIYIVPEPPRH